MQKVSIVLSQHIWGVFTCSILASILTILVKYCGNNHEHWPNTWKMCSPASVILASIVTIIVSFEAILKRFFKYWLNIHEYYHNTYEYCHNTCEYWAGEYTLSKSTSEYKWIHAYSTKIHLTKRIVHIMLNNEHSLTKKICT